MRELNNQGKVHVIHVSTNDNWADIFTKSLDISPLHAIATLFST